MAVGSADMAGGPLRVPRARRLSWAELMQRVFAADVLECSRCHGRMRIVAMIDQPASSGDVVVTSLIGVRSTLNESE